MFCRNRSSSPTCLIVFFCRFRKQEEEYREKRLKIDEKLLEKLDQLIGVAKKAEVNDKEIFKKALDDLVNVNSLFTIAVFVGLSLASRNQHSLDNRDECDAGPDVAKRLVLFEVVSFACFLLSSLIAKSLKVYLNLFRPDNFEGHGLLGWVRGIAFLSSVTASTTGIVLLTHSMADVVQIKVGKLSCRSYYAVTAVATLSVIVFIGLLIYLPSMLFTIYYIMFRIPKQVSSNDKAS